MAYNFNESISKGLSGSLGVSIPLSQGYSSGGSVNSAYNQSGSSSWSNSATDAMSAREWSAMQAEIAWARDMAAYQAGMDFNAEEAQKQRDWQEQMANTIYTRSVKNMREAGINPILAANMGLSGAAVGSGATASIGGAPSAPLAQSFMDSWSASGANSWGMGESNGNSWNSSENGLVTALSALGSLIGNALDNVQSATNINIALDNLKNWNNAEMNHEKKLKADDAVKRNDYQSPDYPHEPGRHNADVEGERKLVDKIVDFAKNIFG